MILWEKESLKLWSWRKFGKTALAACTRKALCAWKLAAWKVGGEFKVQSIHWHRREGWIMQWGCSVCVDDDDLSPRGVSEVELSGVCVTGVRVL